MWKGKIYGNKLINVKVFYTSGKCLRSSRKCKCRKFGKKIILMKIKSLAYYELRDYSPIACVDTTDGDWRQHRTDHMTNRSHDICETLAIRSHN